MLASYMFTEQAAAANDTARRKCYWTTRRAGKTTTILSGDFIADAVNYPRERYAFIALTRRSAEQIAWPILHRLNHDLGINARLLEGKLQMQLPNGATIDLFGADRPGWQNRLLGQRLRKAAIDEAAFYQSISLRQLEFDILGPALSDLRGSLILASVAGYSPRGFFFDCATGKEPGWSVHRWSALDNPFMQTQFAEEIAHLRSLNPDIDSDPSFRRNYLGEFVADYGDRVYRFDASKNLCDAYDKEATDWQYVLGIDLGWHDKTAFCVLAWSHNAPHVYVVEVSADIEMTLDVAASHVRMYMDTYPNLRIIGDSSRREAFEELRKRYQLPISPADRMEKRSWIELVNSDLVTQQLQLVRGHTGGLQDELDQLTWLTRPSGQQIETPGQPNDLCDAMLYAYKEAYHYRYQKPDGRPERGTRAYVEQREKQLEQQLESRMAASGKGLWEKI